MAVDLDTNLSAGAVQIDVCPACGLASDRCPPIFAKHNRTVCRCSRCGLKFVNPRPDESSISGIYTRDYFQAGGFEQYGYRDYAKMLDLKRWTFDRWLGDIRAFVPTGQLLEVGCATGLMLELAREAGWGVTGVEVSRYAAEEARHRGVTVYNCKLDDAPLQPQSFDLALMLDLIEHVPDPAGLLRTTARLLKPGGCVYIVTPNAGSLSARLQGKAWPHMKPREHLCLFTKTAMRSLLEHAGFSVIDISRSKKIITFAHLGGELAQVNPGLSRIIRAGCAVVPGLSGRQFYLPLGEMRAVARKS